MALIYADRIVRRLELVAKTRRAIRETERVDIIGDGWYIRAAKIVNRIRRPMSMLPDLIVRPKPFIEQRPWDQTTAAFVHNFDPPEIHSFEGNEYVSLQDYQHLLINAVSKKLGGE